VKILEEASAWRLVESTADVVPLSLADRVKGTAPRLAN